MSRNDGLNLDRLDSDAADLDLVVESPEDLEHAVIPVPTAVAGAVDAIARIVSLRFTQNRESLPAAGFRYPRVR